MAVTGSPSLKLPLRRSAPSQPPVTPHRHQHLTREIGLRKALGYAT